MEQSNLHDGHTLALQEALELWRTLGHHGLLPDLCGGHIRCITGDIESAESIGTALRTA